MRASLGDDARPADQSGLLQESLDQLKDRPDKLDEALHRDDHAARRRLARSARDSGAAASPSPGATRQHLHDLWATERAVARAA